jgi:hypothetical protein
MGELTMSKKKRVDLESISIMPENDLLNLRNRLFSQHNFLSEKNEDSKVKDIEIELCYVDREVEVRKKRKELHTKWLKENPIEYFEDAIEEEEVYSEFESEKDMWDNL